MNIAIKNDDFNGIVIAQSDGRITTTSRDIAEKFRKAHKNIVRDIRNLDCSLEFSRLNFEQTPYVDPQNGQTYQMYNITRDGFTFLAMGFTGSKAAAWKEKYIAAFNAMEAKLHALPIIDVRNKSQLAQIAVQLIEVTQEQAVQIESMKEDVQAHERLTKADGSLAITDAAKNLGLRPKDLFQWLNGNGWIYKRAGCSYWLGYQSKCNSGLLEHKSTTVLRADGSEKITEQVRVTAKGLARLAKLVKSTAQEVPQ